jgi:chemotaxis protein CheX
MVNVKIIHAFVLSTVHVIKTMAFIETVGEAPYLKNGDSAHGDVSGIIGFTGSVVGSLAVSFSENCILKIVSSMLGEEIVSIGTDIEDAVGELTNMISGAARRRLQRERLIISASIPSVIYGKDHVIRHVLASPSIVIPFTTGNGPFVIDICVKENK